MDSAEQTVLLKISNLTHRFGVVTALAGISLDVFERDFLAIFGPNGAGKTTLLKLIARLIKPSAGSIRFVTPADHRGREQIGYVSHQTLLYGDLTGIENLLFYARLYGLPDPAQQAEEQLRRMGLEAARNRPIRTYSSGMKQRLSIGRALLHDPSLLLLDEPYAGLDQHGSRLLTKRLTELKQEGRTVLLITHNLEEGLALSNRVLVMNQSRIVYEAGRQELARDHFESLYFGLIEG